MDDSNPEKLRLQRLFAEKQQIMYAFARGGMDPKFKKANIAEYDMMVMDMAVADFVPMNAVPEGAMSNSTSVAEPPSQDDTTDVTETNNESNL